MRTIGIAEIFIIVFIAAFLSSLGYLIYDSVQFVKKCEANGGIVIRARSGYECIKGEILEIK